MKYEIITTGRENATIINNDLLIDNGLTMKETKEKIDVYKLKYVFYTHMHEDHINIPSLKYMLKQNKKLIIYMNAETYKYIIDLSLDINFYNIRLIEPGEYVLFNRYKIIAYAGIHDVEVNIYEVQELKSNENLLYATDTENFIGIPYSNEYNYMLLESNHDELYNNMLSHSRTSEHTSHEITTRFFIEHMKNKNSKLERLHLSNMYT